MHVPATERTDWPPVNACQAPPDGFANMAEMAQGSIWARIRF